MISLFVATEGPCLGHLCDNCVMCKRGTCCRRDKPDYQLPEFGSWRGPVFGEPGILLDDGDKAECHICGKYFGHLGNHVVRGHFVWPEEYKVMFGLNAGTGLIGSGLAEIRRQNSGHLREYQPNDNRTPEQRSFDSSGRKVRLESKLRPAFHQQKRGAARKAHETLKQKVEAGLYQYPKGVVSHLLTPEMKAKSKAKLQAMLADPVAKKAWADKIAASRLGQETPERKRACLQCKEEFVLTRWSEKLYCSDECRYKVRSERMYTNPIGVSQFGDSNPTKRGDVRKKLSDAAKKRQIVRDVQGRIVTFRA